MRRALSATFAFGLILSFALPVFAAPPTIPCTLSACCREPCGTWCVDWNGNYQSCQWYVGACDGACDLQSREIGDSSVEPTLDDVTFDELFPLTPEAPAPLHSPAPATAGCAA